jgi:hypothetical protein
MATKRAISVLVVAAAAALALIPAGSVLGHGKKAKVTASGTLTNQPGNPGQVNYSAKFTKPVNGYELVFPGRTVLSGGFNFCHTLTSPSPGSRICMNDTPFKKPTGSLITSPATKKGQGAKLFGFQGQKKIGPFKLTGP